MNQILMVEDDQSLINGLVYAIEKAGYDVQVARTGMEMRKLWSGNVFDLVILDVNLPDTTGFDICEEIRSNSKVPILFLTAADEETDIVRGLDIGGDDYITKPFKLSVLISRINALIRRTRDYASDNTELRSQDICIDRLKGEVRKGKEKVELTAGEYKLLLYLMENKGVILSATQILAYLWDYDEKYVDANTLTVYIRRLRTKIEDDPGNPRHILTVRGRGYKWNEDNNE